MVSPAGKAPRHEDSIPGKIAKKLADSKVVQAFRKQISQIKSIHETDEVLEGLKRTFNLKDLQDEMKTLHRDAKKRHYSYLNKHAIELAKRDAKVNLHEAKTRFAALDKVLDDLDPSRKSGLLERIFRSRKSTLKDLDKEITKAKKALPQLLEKLFKLHPQELKGTKGMADLFYVKRIKMNVASAPNSKNPKLTKSLIARIEQAAEPLTPEQINDVKRQLMVALILLGIPRSSENWESLLNMIGDRTSHDAKACIELLQSAGVDSFTPFSVDQLKSSLNEAVKEMEKMRAQTYHWPIGLDPTERNHYSPVVLNAVNTDFGEMGIQYPALAAKGQAIILLLQDALKATH